MKERVGVTDSELDDINRHAPFSHATTKAIAAIIDEFGLKPRNESGSESTYCGPLRSRGDRVYFSAVKTGGYHSINALLQIFKWKMKVAREEGVIYLLKYVPDELAPFLVIDEDCLGEARSRNEEIKEKEWKWHCDNALASLDLIGSFAIKHAVPRDVLFKMNVDDFCKRFRVDCSNG